MNDDLRLISSMATKPLLADLADAWQASGGGLRLQVESVGGVDAARRVQGGEAFDAVVLAANAIDQLIDAGRVQPGSRVDLVRSGVAVAVKEGAPAPDIGSESALRAAVLAAPSIGYSTGPSGVALVKLFERWGIAAQVGDRLRQAPPGVPVGRLVAGGEVALGFQQLSELMALPGIRVVGPLPDAVQITTVFSAGVCSAGSRPDAVRALLAWMASPATDPLIRRHGMEPAR
ncbi:MAG: substrate-binding domain-containing protein [Rubrivivax sp.]